MMQHEQQPAARKLSHEEARMEQMLYWSGRTTAERIAASRALTVRLYRMRGIEIDEQDATLTPRRVPRRTR